MTRTAILELIGVLGGFEGIKWLITFMAHRKHEKRLKENEVSQSEVATENAIRDMYEDTLTKMRELDEKRITEMRQDYSARIAELNKTNVDLSKQNLDLLKECRHKNEVIADLESQIHEIQELRVEDARKIGELEKQVQFYKSWKCFREYGKGGEKCPRRKPQQNPPLKFEPLEGEESV